MMLQPRNYMIVLSLAYALLVMPLCITCQQTGHGHEGLHLVEPTPALQAKERDLTTVVLVKNAKNEQYGRFHSLRPELGLLTTTARTFIQEGVTTEYATQVLGTTLDNGRVYAQYLRKSSRVLYENELPSPSVVTSWVGESKTGLLQSHNDLLHADEPGWQEIDDSLRHVFVGNTDFVGRLSEKHIANVEHEAAASYSKLTDALQTVTKVPTIIQRNLDEDARKLAAQKVLPIADLPTYTVKQHFSPSGFFWSDDENENLLIKKENDSSLKDRSPKLYYPKIMSGAVKADLKPNSFVSDFLPKRKLATTTYYGFADFTTIVGDSVIVFSPSSSSHAMNLGQVTSIKGEATIGEYTPPQISKVAISINEDLIIPTQVQQTEMVMTTNYIEDNKETTEREEEKIAINIEKNNSFIVSSVEPSEVPSVAFESLMSTETSATQPILNDITTSVSPALSRPSDEEVSAIFALLQNKDGSKIIQTSQQEMTMITTTTAAVASSDSVADLSSSSISPVSTLGGATTVFIEEDPFVNFVESSIETINLETTETKTTQAAEETVEKILTSESISATSSILNSETTTDDVVIKEITDEEAFKDIECIRTSQVFLTQLPKTLTYLTTHIINNGESLSESIETAISNTFDIVETTKKYCIQITETAPAITMSTKQITTLDMTTAPTEPEEPEEPENSTEESTESPVTKGPNIGDPNIHEREHESETTTISNETDEYGSDDDSNDDSEDESGEEIELIYKTLYTTYTYLTTIFQDLSSNVLSHTEVVTNVITSTLGGIESSIMTESTDILNNNVIVPTSVTSIGENQITALSGLESIIRAGEDSAEDEHNTDIANDPVLATELLEDIKITKTFHTTYTYFTTIFAEGETEIISRTEVLTNIVTTTPTISIRSNTQNISAFTSTHPQSTSSEIAATTILNPSLDYSTMTRSSTSSSVDPALLDLNQYSSITLVTDVRSSSSNGEGHVINKTYSESAPHYSPEQILALDDQISSESNTEEIIPAATLLLQTSFTTFTYYTTMYTGDTTSVVSRLETITNVVTETLQPSRTSDHFEDATNNLPVTYFTTFTYWTKLAKDGTISTLSREETISNVITPTLASSELTASSIVNLESVQPFSAVSKIIQPQFSTITKILEPTTYYTTYTYYTTSYESDLTITNSRFETVTNMITPTVTLSTEIGIMPSSSSTQIKLEQSTIVDANNLPTKQNSLIFYDYKKIIDADGISTLYFMTQVAPSTYENGIIVEATSSTSSLFIDEIKKALSPTPILQSTVDGSTISVRQYKTGLVRLIEGTRIGNSTTTLYQSKVIGTLINNRYAQIIESTSSFLFEKTSMIGESSQLNILPTKIENSAQQSTLSTLGPNTAAVLETSISDSTDNPTQENSSNQDEVENEDEENQANVSPNSRKKTFTPVIRPFASRNRPQFAPKRKNIGGPSSATIITRSDFTPTITATPALKSSGLGGRFSSSRRGSSQLSNISSSKRFSRPSKTFVGQQLIGSSSISSSGRNRFASSNSRRPVTPLRSSGTNFRPGLSSAYAGSSRFRIKPTGSGFALNTATSSKLPLTTQTPSSTEETDDDEEETSTQVDEEEVTTTENSRRSQNPLLRFRRPPAISIPRAGSSGSNNFVSTRRNPLTSRVKTPTTTATTTTTTARSRPRSFQRPPSGLTALTARQRPQSSLFPPRGLFQAQKQEANTEATTEKKEKPEAEDDSDYDEEDGDNDEEDGENDEEENAKRRRRSNSKKSNKNTSDIEGKINDKKKLKRSKRDADVSFPSRSNFRSKFRQRPKSSTTEETPSNESTEKIEPIPPTRSGRLGSRFGNKHATTTGTSQTTITANRRAIRPTRPTSGRAQFTLREKDITTTTKSLSRLGSSSFRRPKTTASSRRSQTPLSSSRRLKSYANNNIGSETSSRNGNSANSRSRVNNLSAGRSRSNSGRGRNRSDYNAELATNSFDGTITVTHVSPAEVTIPVVNGQLTEYKNVITAKTSTEVLGPQQYTSFVGANGQTTLALTREEKMTNLVGATEITQFILHGSATTTITFTPTTIRGRKTSFSHVLPSTVYSVESVVSTMQPQLGNAPLANILLSQLLLGNLALPGNPTALSANPLLGALPQLTTQAPATPVTEFRTHTSTYVTTLFEGMSTVVPVTFQGKKIITTVYDTTAQTITATEFITDTIVSTPTQQPMQQAGQINSLLLQQLLLQQQFQPQLNQDQLPLKHLLQPESNLQELDTNNLQESKYDDESIPVVEETSQLSKTTRKKSRKSGKSGKNGNRRNKQAQDKLPAAESSVITLYVSGRRPGEFSTVLSTVLANSADSTLKKRQAVDITVEKTATFDNNNQEDYYETDGTEIINQYQLPEEFLNPSPHDAQVSQNLLIDSSEQVEQTQTLESIVGDVRLWYAKSSVSSFETPQSSINFLA